MEEQTRSLSEVAGLMGVSERTVRRWIKSGRLKAYKPGRDYRIPETALRRFIEESEISPKVQGPPSPLEPSLFNGLEEERREREEYAEALMTIWGDEGEHLEEEAMSSPEGFPLGRAYIFSVGQGFAQALYEEIADARRPSESLQKAKERLDAISRRIGALWNQTMHPGTAEALREFQTFAQRRAEARRSRDEGNNTGTQDTGTGRAG